MTVSATRSDRGRRPAQQEKRRAQQGHRTRTREDARVPRPDPLALDPYSPIFPARAPEWDDPDPLALNPYSPIVPTRAPEGEDAGS
jgi:hypothetical protein